LVVSTIPDLLGVPPPCEVAELGLNEDQAERVLKHLHLWIAAEAALRE
jgi:hypothetical protein